MIWPWHISFRPARPWPALLFAFTLAFAGATPAASVSGAVRLADSLDPAVRKHGDYSGVVVWLEPSGEAYELSAGRPITARMEQKGKRFIPHILAIPAGSRVVFPNLDPIFHSAFSNFSGQVFDLGLYAPHTSKTITFARPGVVRVFCNIHPTMSAVILVLKTSWYAVTSTDGSFQVADVPAGEYRIRVFHERATQKTLDSLERRISVQGTAVHVPPLVISETGYVQTPHRNKYGHDYPPGSGEGGAYPGGAS